MTNNITPHNTDREGNCLCLKANYYKMGMANFVGHTSDGLKATCVMELQEPQILTPKRTDFGKQTLRIRKLTPRECFRLMDVSEPDIDKLLNAGISNSQLYKLAGNSIVVSCLYHIMRKMFCEPQNEHQQLTLF